MKLKKIVSLAAAALMAVSMLTACGEGNSNSGDGSTVKPAETAIVAAVNDGQSAANKVKIEFTSDAKLDAALSSAVKAFGENVNDNGLKTRVSDITGLLNSMADLQGYTGMAANGVAHSTNQPKDGANGAVNERVSAFVISGVLNEDVAMQKAAANIDGMVADMKATSYEKGTTKGGEKYCDYSYTGSVSMVSLEKADGQTVYCFAYTISQTTSVKTLAPEA